MALLMKGLFKCFFLLVLLFASCGGGRNSPQHSGAAIEFDDTTFDFGTLRHNGRQASHAFRFTNAGNAPLVVQQTLTSCQCSNADFPKHPVAPGATGIVTVTLDPSQMSTGRFMRSVVVYSNSGNRRSMLIVSGRVK